MSNPSQPLTNTNLNQRQLEIFRRLAAREAARRQQVNETHSDQQQPTAATEQDRNSPSTSSALEKLTINDSSIIKIEQLQEILQQEKAKNDLAWAKVRERVHRLDPPTQPTINEEGGNEQIREKRLELEYLDYEIEQVEKQLSTIGTTRTIPTNTSQSSSQATDEILALLTRSILASSVEQYEVVNETLQKQLDKQKEELISDDELLYDLNEILIGLQKRKEVLENRMNSVDFASIEGKLLERVDGIENELSYFLQSLIEISSKIFDDEAGLQQAQLRHLIDTLINKAWDTPIDPYVDVSQDYLPAIYTFLLRANIAVEHPRDSQRIRLIDFHRLQND